MTVEDVERLREMVRVQDSSGSYSMMDEAIELYSLLLLMVLNGLGTDRRASCCDVNTDITVQFMERMKGLGDKHLIDGSDLHMDVSETFSFCTWLCCSVYWWKNGKSVIHGPCTYFSERDEVIDY